MTMSRTIIILCLVFTLGSCSIFSTGDVTGNLDNACSILDQKPQFARAFKATKRRWGVPVNVQMAIIHQESRFKSKAKTPRKYILGFIPNGRQSSAYGYAQALDGTWSEYKDDTGRILARRSNIRDASDFMGWYMTKTKRRNGISLADKRNQYLAYHEGQTGFARGSYKRKKWLINIAGKVANRSDMYKRQLSRCGRL